MVQTFWDRLMPNPFLDSVQVNISTRCNAACRYCPTGTGKLPQRDRLMDMTTFEAVSDIFPYVNYVHLQGWGEPFLHPDFFRMVAAVKAVAVPVGATTNGVLMTDDLMERIIAAELDVLTFSLAGIGEAHNRNRKGTDFQFIMETISRLNALKTIAGKLRPQIHVAYLLTQSDRSAIPALPTYFSGKGISEVMISSLAWAPDAAVQREMLSTLPLPVFRKLQREIAGLNAERTAHDPVYRPYLIHPRAEGTGCLEHTNRSLVIGVEGAVWPCIMAEPICANVPAKGIRKKIVDFQGFGNVNSRSLGGIWWSRAYRTFRHSGGGDMRHVCRMCPKKWTASPNG